MAKKETKTTKKTLKGSSKLANTKLMFSVKPPTHP
jgi:hypothetical protein